MVAISCTVTGCEYATDDLPPQYAMELLGQHRVDIHNVAAPAPVPAAQPRATSRPPSLDRPKIDAGVTIEQWNMFTRKWELYRTGSSIDEASAPAQLFQCAGEHLGDSLLKSDSTITTKPLADLISAMKSLAVVPVATGVLRSDLLQLRQDHDEPFRNFAARVRGKAEPCAFKATCKCGENVDYTDHVIKDVLISGISDLDIRRDVLGTIDIITSDVKDVVALVEGKEMARNALPTPGLSAISTFKRQNAHKIDPNAPVASIPSASDRHLKRNCPDCGNVHQLFSEGTRGWNKKTHRTCIDCYRAKRRQPVRKGSASAVLGYSVSLPVVSESVTPLSQISNISTGSPAQNNNRVVNSTLNAQHPSQQPVHLDHRVFTKGEWKRARLRDHPRVQLGISLDNKHLTTAGRSTTHPTATVQAIADSGAQSDIWSLDAFLRHGFSKMDLSPVKLSLSAANRSPIPIEGAFLAVITGIGKDCKRYMSRSMIYVSSAISDLFLSYDTMLNLGILHTDFPSVGSRCSPTKPSMETPTKPMSSHLPREINACSLPLKDDTGPCTCPQRSAPPPLPAELPFECTPDNIDSMKEWILKRYASSTFNTCPHGPLPSMNGPPVEIHLDPDAPPKACSTPANIPIHWQDQVHKDLLRDEALGVVERVPYGEPVSWCHRMVVTRKHDGSPRRTVDLSPLNKHCKRETHAMESPFHLARRIPKGAWKTVTDAWNGYHSVPLRESDKHLTNFITPFGLWRYRRAPQGFLSSGDGYNRRFDAILTGFLRKERCVDDTIHYDMDLEEHWWRTLEFLNLVGGAGVVLNPKKFQFSGKETEFAGFKITNDSIEPLPKYLDAIRDFPTPKSTTDIRSWFGLVNQVSNYGQLRDTMAPFKPFLSPKCTFVWTDELAQAFTASKEHIVTMIQHGVRIFDPNLPTCLRPDWSKSGIGYWLFQQHCSCPSGLPGCCPEGWLVTLAGSRFLSSAESRYAPIEGEALAVAWGLEQTRYFTQGCDDLRVVTDHKPLVKIFGDRTLDEITNTRLFRLKQRTLPWKFSIFHLPGKTNLAADATSRHPTGTDTPTDGPDATEAAMSCSIQRDAADIMMLTWELIADETAKDPSLRVLLELCSHGFPQSLAEDSIADLSPFWPIRDALYDQDGVLIYKDRVVIPSSLRHQVLLHLHAAHQGVSSMERRARTIAYWPGISQDIQRIRAQCTECNRHAPSQAAAPPILSSPPSTPFEQIFADFFTHAGHHYLVVGDRLSGWTEILAATSGTTVSGASGLIRHLRSFFSTFGVPEELSSDGGPEFSASLTQDFLKRWGIRHRVSSVAFPQSNGRAEVAVKAAKRILMSNISQTGELDNDKLLRAMLQQRNTPDPDCNVSPAEIVFGRNIRDAFSFINRIERFSNPHIHPRWHNAWQAKEVALKHRFARSMERLEEHARPLAPLAIGDRVFVQNQIGPSPKKWDRTGMVVDTRAHDQYLVKIDGSGRLTLRNRRFLRSFTRMGTEITTHLSPAPTATQVRAPPLPSTTADASRPVSALHPPCSSPNTPPPNLVEDPPVPPPSPPPDVVGPDEVVRHPSPVTPSQDASTPAAGRPKRTIKPRKMFIPETGQWSSV